MTLARMSDSRTLLADVWLQPIRLAITPELEASPPVFIRIYPKLSRNIQKYPCLPKRLLSVQIAAKSFTCVLRL